MLASRSAEKLAAAHAEIQADAPSADVHIATLDASDEAAVAAFAASLPPGEWDGLVVTAAGRAPHGRVCDLETAAVAGLFDSKFWSAYHACKHLAPRLADGGAVELCAGVLNRRPGLNYAPLACVNGALEGLTRSLALELGPRLRVNCLSPGFCDTERFAHMPPERKREMLANTAASLPMQRVGTPADMGGAIAFLLASAFITGVVLDCDGGHSVRQYATAADDPMRAGTSPQTASQ